MTTVALPELRSLQEIADLFHVSTKTVRDWAAQGMPVHSQGRRGGGEQRLRTMFDLRAVTEWYFRVNFERLELDRQRARLASEQAQKLHVENAARLAAVGEFEIWQAAVAPLFAAIRAALRAFPARVAPRVSGDVNQREACLEAAVTATLRELAAFRAGGRSRRR